MVPIRRLTASNPALSPASAANSSAVFLNDRDLVPAPPPAAAASSRSGTSATPA